MILGIYQSLILLFVFHGFTTNTADSTITHINGITAVIGTDGIVLNCSSISNKTIFFVKFSAENDVGSFVDIAESSILPVKSTLLPYGDDLFGSNNTTISHLALTSRSVVLTFNELKCKHERSYKCRVTIEADVFGSLPEKIIVTVPPSKPNSILYVYTPAEPSPSPTKHMENITSSPSTAVTSNANETVSASQTEKQNTTTSFNHSTIQTTRYDTTTSTPPDDDVATNKNNIHQTTTAQDVAAGDTVTVICVGDVGKPSAEYIFQKYLNGMIVDMEDTVITTSISDMSENCSYYRTSNLTFQVTAADNNVVIRCVVNSSMAQPDMYIETEPIEVYYEVSMPTIIRYPNKPYYVVGEDTSINLTCKTDGNPKPTYQWYKENNMELLSTSANLTIMDMNVTNNGVYTCTANNTFKGDIYRNTSSVKIQIMNKAYTTTTRITLKHSSTLDDIPTTQSSSTESSPGVDKKEEKKSNEDLGLVAGIVGAVVAVIIVIIVIIACKRRKSKSPTFKNVSKSFDDSKPKPVPEPRTGDYDYIALEDDAPKTKNSNNGLEAEDINKHNEEYLKKQEEEEKKKNESNTQPQLAVYAQVNEASKLRNKQKAEAIDSIGKQEEDTYAETQEGIYDKAGDRRHKENENDEHYDSSTNSSKQNSNGDSKQAIQTSQVGSYANQGFEKDDNRKVATVSPTVRSSSGSQNDEQTNSNRNSQSKKGYENIIGTEQTGLSEDDSSHRTAL